MDNEDYENRLSKLEENQKNIQEEQIKINNIIETIHDMAAVAAFIHDDAQEIANRLFEFKNKVTHDISSMYDTVIKMSDKAESISRIAIDLKNRADSAEFEI
jgi:hypothetical protein